MIVLLGYLTVLLEYIDELSMQHGICMGELAPAPLTPRFADLEKYTLQYYNVRPRGLSMIILQMGRL